jgi:hypothetical protein
MRPTIQKVAIFSKSVGRVLKKKGSFGGGSMTQRDEVTEVKSIGSRITSGGDQHYRSA